MVDTLGHSLIHGSPCIQNVQGLGNSSRASEVAGHDMSDSVDEPQFLQNLESSGFSVWHFGHFIIDAPRSKERSS